VPTSLVIVGQLAGVSERQRPLCQVRTTPATQSVTWPIADPLTTGIGHRCRVHVCSLLHGSLAGANNDTDVGKLFDRVHI